MRVILNAQDVCHEQPRGIGNYVIDLYKALIERKQNEYALVYCDKDGEKNNRSYIDRYYSTLNVPIYECQKLHYGHASMNDVYRNQSFLDYFGVNGDVVHFPLNIGAPNNVGARLVVTVHDLFPITYYEHYPWSLKSVFLNGLMRMEKANAVVTTNSEYTKCELCYYTPILPERVHVVPHGYNVKECYPERDSSVSDKYGITDQYFLYFGAIDERKNIRRILDAFNILVEKYPMCKLVIAGGNESVFEDLHERVQQEMLSQKVIYTGYVTNHERRALMSGTVAFLFPSLAEGFGIPILEAMACGAPVITSNVSGMPEVAGDASILIDPTNTEQLAFEMERLLNSETLRNELITKGFERCKCFSWEKTAEMTEKVYEYAVSNY